MREPMKATKKPVTIDFIEWTGGNLYEVITFTQGKPENHYNMAASKWDEYQDLVDKEGLIVATLEGHLKASIGDMIIKGISGEFYPCKPDIFALTYNTSQTESSSKPLKEISTENLLKEILSREKVSDAPVKTTYGEGMKIFTVGIGNDEIATVSIHAEGIALLENS